MRIRGRDENGDILPVLGLADLVSGGEAVALLVKDRLTMYTGEWWENPEWGNGILEMLKESRLTEADQQVLANYISGYIRKTPGVLDVREVKVSVEGRRFRYSCEIVTENGTARVQYE